MRVTLDKNHVRRSGNSRNQKQTEGSVGSVPQVSSGIDFERLPIMPQTTSFQHGGHADIDFRRWNVDTHAETRKDDEDCATKNASPHSTDEKKIQDTKESYKQKR